MSLPDTKPTSRIPRPADFIACPACFSAVDDADDVLRCTSCHATYPFVDGIPVLLPPYDDDVRRRYLDNYERMAEADIDNAFEVVREARHAELLKFVGDVSGSRVLDIGSSQAIYLRELAAKFKLALDIALPYLHAIPVDADIALVCGDAERLPFLPGSFEVIVVADVLEHVLDPHALASQVHRIATKETRIIVEVPWEEDVTGYADDSWEFSHLRTFNLFSFSTIWSRFEIVRMRDSLPRLDTPLFLEGRRGIPLWLLNRLRLRYHHGHLGEADFDWRTRRRLTLPHGSRLLLRYSRPRFRQFELRPFTSQELRQGRRGDRLDRAVAAAGRLLSRLG